jgi:hypothetical protein
MNQVCMREDLHYTVIHPCHPALFKDQPTLEGYNDHFGGIAGLQDIVSTQLNSQFFCLEQTRHRMRL